MWQSAIFSPRALVTLVSAASALSTVTRKCLQNVLHAFSSVVIILSFGLTASHFRRSKSPQYQCCTDDIQTVVQKS